MESPAESLTLEVRRDDWATARVLHQPLAADLGEDEVLLRVERFALTANNISYCFSGDLLGYWGFFPAEEGWGRIPVMGYARVLASANSLVAVGERVWGFFPMSTHLRVKAGKVNPHSFVDVSPHRAAFAPVYAQYQRAAGNPIYEPAREDQDSLLRGLFLTSWLCEDFLHDNGGFGAGACLITSASSKTSIALAHTLAARGELRTVGITSSGNLDFCRELGCYADVLSYDQIEDLNSSEAVVLVDMAGSADITGRVHRHFAEQLRYSCMIGATHYQEAGTTEGLPGATPAFFFAPTQAQKRTAEWGPGEIERRMGQSFVAFRRFCDGWLKVVRHWGPEASQAAYQQVLDGRQSPREGCIVSLWDAHQGIG